MKQNSSIFKYLSSYKKEIIIAPLFKLLEAIFDLLCPLIVGFMIDSDIIYGGYSNIIKYFILLLLMAFLGLSCSTLAQLFSARASVGYAKTLREKLFFHINTLSFSDIDKIGEDTLLTTLSSDIEQIQTGVNMTLRLLLRSPFIVFGAAIMALIIDKKISIIFFSTIPLLSLVVFLIMRFTIPLYSQTQKKLDNLTKNVRESTTGVRVIRAFCQEEEEKKEFKNTNDSLTRLNIFAGKLSSLLNPLTYTIINFAIIILIRNASIKVNLGLLPQGEVVALYNYMSQIIVELIKLASLIITINKALSSKKRVEKLLNTSPSIVYKEEKKEQNTEEKIVFNHVSFSYNNSGSPVLSDISFSIKEGQRVGIIGGTGSGKTTLINLIPRFYDVTKGEVLINGRNITTYSKESLVKAITVVSQKTDLFKGTIRDNLKIGNEDATDSQLWDALYMSAMDNVVREKGGLDYTIEEKGRNLSGGQKQRLSISRAIVKNSDILILDDSSSALDYKTDSHIRTQLKKLKDKTIIVVSQRIVSVKDSDLIIVLDKGRIVGMGKDEELMKSCDIYKDIYSTQYKEKEEMI